ncbi:FUSC family protein [Streptomyces sp. NPDC004680]|uniref:FUSC family protein n=1 Tax=Streptomyces sp. NPDC004680 TaxID=3154287 RepID=UPI0033A978FE
MPRLQLSHLLVTGSGRRRPAADLARVLTPRGALSLHQVDGAFACALHAALAMALPALPLVLTGRADQAVYVMLGAFTTTFGHNLPYPRRARVLALAALAMTACVAGGSTLAAWAHPREGGSGAVVVVAATAVVAGSAKFACDAARQSGLGAVLLLFSFAVAANASPDVADVLPQTALAAVGAAVAWALAMSGRLVQPDRPQRLAVAAALRRLAGLLESGEARHGAGPARNRATAAVLQAYVSLGLPPPTGAGQGVRGGLCARLADLSWSLLIGSARRSPVDHADLARHLRRQVRLLTDRRRRVPPLLPELLMSVAAARTGAAGDTTGTAPEPIDPAAGRAAETRAAELLVGRHQGRPSHVSVLVVPALRIVLGTGLAGGLAVALNLGHGYWAAISAAAVLHSINVRTAAQRAVQRTVGTVAGLVVALAVLALRPDAATLVLVIVLLEFLLEYVVSRNYGLGVVFLTPLALLLTELAAPPEPPGTLVLDRAVGSILGIVIGLVCGLLVVHDRAAVRAERALAACTEAAEHAERALDERSAPAFPVVQTHLAMAVVELREADDAAAGELWSAEIDPAELVAVEQRAYRLLERLARGR